MTLLTAGQVRPGLGPKGVTLSAHEDPGGKVKKFERQWVVDHRVKTAVQGSGGKFVISNPLAIRRGDFVDVAALVTVVVHRGRHASSTEVMLAPLEVVRLRTRKEVKIDGQALLRGPDPHDHRTSEADAVLGVVTGFEMGGTMFPDDIEDDKMDDVE
ncbi:hypothetical protein GSI_02251 [Ganoderma sinense ZZ0214-1]|uniref:Uncharacterized protein n=1 Tax=Ganoderma sinense ZZ0214-1 TaxID=1077348 RepID=A0A2G8SP78_9APHY|nr:hypothetical protein GSI_02251 [Ganoderma sinense ZZ0214-1]